jgi:hypothetical protein
MIFIYLQKNHFLISEKTQRELREKHQDLELIRTFRTIQDARSWVMKQSREVLDLVAKQHTGITPEGRERMRERKRGMNNPNAGGLSASHRANISRNKKRMYLRDGNPMYNRKHTLQTRRKMSWGQMRKMKRRWMVDPAGREHLMNITFPLPPGWVLGRARGQAGRHIL